MIRAFKARLRVAGTLVRLPWWCLLVRLGAVEGWHWVCVPRWVDTHGVLCKYGARTPQRSIAAERKHLFAALSAALAHRRPHRRE